MDEQKTKCNGKSITRTKKDLLIQKKISPFILFNFNGNLFGGKWVIRCWLGGKKEKIKNKVSVELFNGITYYVRQKCSLYLCI